MPLRRIPRTRRVRKLIRQLDAYPVVAILGPRRIGKTTLARDAGETFAGPAKFFDLEDERAVASLRDPKQGWQDLRGLVVLDDPRAAAANLGRSTCDGLMAHAEA